MHDKNKIRTFTSSNQHTTVMKALLIDPTFCEVREIEIDGSPESFCKAVGKNCKTVMAMSALVTGDIVYVEQNAVEDPRVGGFMMKGWSGFSLGRGLVVGYRNGRYSPPNITKTALKRRVGWAIGIGQTPFGRPDNEVLLPLSKCN